MPTEPAKAYRFLNYELARVVGSCGPCIELHQHWITRRCSWQIQAQAALYHTARSNFAPTFHSQTREDSEVDIGREKHLLVQQRPLHEHLYFTFFHDLCVWQADETH